MQILQQKFQKKLWRAAVILSAFIFLSACWLHVSHAHEEGKQSHLSSQCELCLSSAQFQLQSGESFSLSIAPTKFFNLLNTEPHSDYYSQFWHFASIRGPPFLV
ncbi:MAG: hypothetical protein H7A32_00970 [Deltaproteobacteria bacterium]|nr:hypothetical protein [Deltaproteobacteria bacterium]